MSLPVLLDQFLKQPTPELLLEMQPIFLSIDHPSAQAAHKIAGHFYTYLSAVRGKVETKQFPVLATALVVSSTGVNIAEEIFSERRTNIWNLVADGMRVALDTLSTYQFVKQWETDFGSVHDAATWNLYAAYWHLSMEYQPDIELETRAQAMHDLFRVVREPEVDNALRLASMVQLFQWALIARLAPLLVA